MKVFFVLLLLSNIAFAVFQWLLPYDQLFTDRKTKPVGVELQLLTEANTQTYSEPAISEPEVLNEVGAETDAIADAVAAIEQRVESEPSAELVAEDNSDKRVCYTVGPIKDRARAIEISGRYSGRQVSTALKSSLEKQYLGVMVYIDGHANRAAALSTARELEARGIRDYLVLKEEGRENLLSLGVFGLKKNADRLKSRVAKMKFPVKTETRYRERTIYWVYAEQSSEDSLLQLLNQAEFDDGISQIPTQCLPI